MLSIRSLLFFFLIIFTGPILMLFSKDIDLKIDWRRARRDSAHIAPDCKTVKEAIVQVYAARAFNWRGLFSVHTWIAVKPTNSPHYQVYDVIGWRTLMGEKPLKIAVDIPDRYWFNQKPVILLDIRGEKAEKLIMPIINAVKRYPFADNYHYWPGPNSNTFTAFIGRQVPQMGLVLPSNAVGKDYLGKKIAITRAASGTGYQLSIYGVAGITLAMKEGLEINMLGLTYGISPAMRTIKLPGIGDIQL
jgi:hypothetical protein